ncbi:MAG: hypothetical protein A3G32_06585 [Deltaproteobacteria bacterium RIFCSPLOWO2_12_FULL_40_28]|nr:MAG: hypothetical protein A3C45_02680 [Deltaproteobacteria bacterium RIFCSPHIGHO2_02_FULL_40_28]OGQ19114.1 MAG: hypothetical protein A3E27_05770 [Deltaproteobacteria bacterium RIFCSPHIGHO2_12_FULL_40_32]OGQ40286.1 MAG: hypothetical protein A3I69_01210 [Deltaproteobacteria bacterium RIFCSPLOWO2_02_FULL_40_36]OGQ53557.1 MAG: hypothetical protein A3G32_06585 [Deltaproteobacteria bacterium RIFCSPLOWO2_12_FULL_40_28]
MSSLTENTEQIGGIKKSMTKLNTLENEVGGELLSFLAEHEEFISAKKAGFSSDEVKAFLVELSQVLKDQGKEEIPGQPRPKYEDLELSPKALSLISCLSPREELLLFRSFKLL